MMLRNMVTSLLAHEKTQTTVAKAKEVRRLTDRVIVLAKRGDLHARRQALAILTNKEVVKKLFSEIGPRFQNRAGGFTRIVRIGRRLGDAAPLSMIMLTEPPATAEKRKTGKAPSKRAKTPQAKAKEKEKKEQAKRRKKVKETEDHGESPEEKNPPKGRTTRKREGPKKRASVDSSQ